MLKTDHLNVDMFEKFAPRPGERALLPELTPKAQVALMCRMLYAEGWDDHIAGHITVRQADGTILTNPWELTWDEVTAQRYCDPGRSGQYSRQQLEHHPRHRPASAAARGPLRHQRGYS